MLYVTLIYIQPGGASAGFSPSGTASAGAAASADGASAGGAAAASASLFSLKLNFSLAHHHLCFFLLLQCTNLLKYFDKLKS